jgi:MoaA/NifB/PqqE/SkfB family radical SAM enzyme
MASLVLELTNRCNFNCVFCRPKDQRTNAELDFDSALTILDSVSKYAIDGNWVNEVSIADNGEPLLYKKLAEVIYEAKKRFPYVSIITNAYLLSQEKSEELLNAGLDRIDISLTGIMPEIYSKFQGSGISPEQCEKNLEKVTDNIIYFAKKRTELKKSTKVNLRYIKTDVSKKHLKEYIKFWGPKGIDRITITPLYDFYRQEGAKIRRCVFPPRNIQISATGDVHPCCNDYAAKSNDNRNLFKLNFENIVYSQDYIDEIKKRKSNKKNRVPETCLTCDYRYDNSLMHKIRFKRQIIFPSKPIKNLFFKFFGLGVILFEMLSQFEFFYDSMVFCCRLQSKMTKSKFNKNGGR